MPIRPDVVAPDITQLKALTHPLRLRLLGLLRTHGPSTATRLGAEVGESSGATSYHLRQLERHGFVEEAGDLGSARERWWRASATFTSYEAGADGDREVEGAFHQAVIAQYAGRLRQAVVEAPDLPQDWREASTSSDAVVRVSAAQAREIRRRLEAVVWQVVDEFPAATQEAAPDARLFEVQVHSFVSPGQGDERGTTA